MTFIFSLVKFRHKVDFSSINKLLLSLLDNLINMTLLPTSLAVGVVKGVATTDLGWLWFVVSGLKGTSGRSGGPVESTSYWTLAPPVHGRQAY